VLTATALVIVINNIQVKEIWRLLKKADILFLLLAAFFFIISKIIAAFRLNRFFYCDNIYMPDKYNLKLYWLGMYYNLFLPGGIGGDGYKIYLLNKKTKVKAGTIFQAVLLDRLSGVFALFILAFILLLFMPFTQQITLYLFILFPLFYVGFWYVQKIFFKRYLSVFIKSHIFSLGVQTAQLACAFFILKSIGVINAYDEYFLLFLASSVVAIIPFTIGGVGARELTVYLGANLLNLQTAPAIGLSVLFFLITAVTSLFGIYYSLKGIKENQK